MKSLEVRVAGRRVATLLGDSRHFPALVRSLDTATPRRRAVRAALLAATRTRTTYLISRSVASDSDELTTMLAPVRAAMDDGSLSAAMVLWPTGDRFHRRYVFACNEVGALTAFAKISIRPDLDAESFRAERRALEHLEGSPLSRVRTPRVLDFVDRADLTALVLEAIPAERHHLSWEEVVSLPPLDNWTRTHDPEDLGWTGASASLGVSASFAALTADELPPLRTTIANGDLRPSNVVRAGGYVWVFDWEYGSTAAPVATDLVSAVLNRRIEAGPSPEPSAVLVDLLTTLRDRGVAREEAALAVLYLASTGQPWANQLVRQRWPSTLDSGQRGCEMSTHASNQSNYREEFAREDLAKTYDAKEYGPRSWSTLLWALEQRTLSSLLQTNEFLPRRERYLDFACGTGRVTAFMAPQFGETAGVDISEAMLEIARPHVPGATFRAADVGVEPEVVGADFDLVTSFRFLLNADPGDRLPALHWMRSRLRDANSRVVVNNHSNLWSHKALSNGIRRLRGRGSATTGNVLSHRQVVNLVEAAGFRVESIHGMGFFGGHAMRIIPFDRMSTLQEAMREKPGLQRIGEDQIYVLAPR